MKLNYHWFLGSCWHCKTTRQRERRSRSINVVCAGSGGILDGISNDEHGICSESLWPTGRSYVRLHFNVRGRKCESRIEASWTQTTYDSCRRQPFRGKWYVLSRSLTKLHEIRFLNKVNSNYFFFNTNFIHL